MSRIVKLCLLGISFFVAIAGSAGAEDKVCKRLRKAYPQCFLKPTATPSATATPASTQIPTQCDKYVPGTGTLELNKPETWCFVLPSPSDPWHFIEVKAINTSGDAQGTAVLIMTVCDPAGHCVDQASYQPRIPMFRVGGKWQVFLKLDKTNHGTETYGVNWQ